MMLVPSNPCGRRDGQFLRFSKGQRRPCVYSKQRDADDAVVVVGVVCTFAMKNDVVVPCFLQTLFSSAARRAIPHFCQPQASARFCGAFFMLRFQPQGAQLNLP
jgi:hypothetical protein